MVELKRVKNSLASGCVSLAAAGLRDTAALRYGSVDAAVQSFAALRLGVSAVHLIQRLQR